MMTLTLDHFLHILFIDMLVGGVIFTLEHLKYIAIEQAWMYGYIVIGFTIAYLIRDQIKLSTSAKSIFITGCDSGLGVALVNHLSHVGYTVYAGCLTLDAVKMWNEKRNDKIRAIQIDVTSDASVEAAYQQIARENPHGLWGVVNNAGLGTSFLIEFTPLSTYHRVMDVNLYGTIRVVQKFLPLIKKCKGRIVNVASFIGRYSAWAMSSYSCTKFAVEAFSDSLRQEMYPFGVHVAIAEPGTMRTPMVATVEKNMLQLWSNASESLRAEYGETYLHGVRQSNWLMHLLARDVSTFTGSIHHALTARYPHTRYLDGFDAFAIGCIMSMIPSWISDLATRMIVGNPKPARRQVNVNVDGETHVSHTDEINTVTPPVSARTRSSSRKKSSTRTNS